MTLRSKNPLQLIHLLSGNLSGQSQNIRFMASDSISSMDEDVTREMAVALQKAGLTYEQAEDLAEEVENAREIVTRYVIDDYVRNKVKQC